MLKSCWDCILGYSREQAGNEVIYGSQLNGSSLRAPPWPQQDKENMFILPKILSTQDSITVNGTATHSSRQQIVLNLVTGDSSPDFNNIACQVKATFPSEHTDNKDNITVTIIKNGNEYFRQDVGNYKASVLLEAETFTFKIKLYEGNVADIYINEEYILEFKMIHRLSEIRFLTLNDDGVKVQSLLFEFGNQ